jgi:hypothetical protein
MPDTSVTLLKGVNYPVKMAIAPPGLHAVTSTRVACARLRLVQKPTEQAFLRSADL